ncbi:dienelactone hydrolase family protein [Pseudoalteromonas sp. SG45-1]|uniref:alpha/beta hydrolase family protein n=1 Tax=Pseudoalteromonas sp. SG45-1 TaxID=2760957 RepID=UPI00160206FD|nr:dienelactone hydrolase family protein [Pseudoalteromonas sp. SG45-1]MBB1402047.1 dienelactone hydrolase family protein [Pseudoalteromonas sp. SG45-1]
MTHTLKALSKAILLATCSLSASVAVAESNKPEQLYPPITSEVLPELAAKGSYNVGVQTLDLVNPAQFDPATQGQKDRPLKVEVWYPAANTAKALLTSYTDETRSGKEFTLQADAMRDVVINNKEHYPVIVLSHGYTGYRTIMYYLGEHLASHGYIVVAIDHTDSTNADVDFENAPFSGFFSTLINRSRDQQFVINYFNEQNNFASKQVDNKSAGVIGYSMGGYGAVNTIGGCYAFNEQTTAMFTGMKDPAQIKKVQQLLNSCAGGQYQNPKIDPRIKAMVAFAPWGGQHAIFDAKAMENIKVPSLYVAGDLDDISGYEGIKSLYEQTGSKDKYMLTYKNARHNIAPHPAPAIAQSSSELDIGHYYEPSWSMRTLNETNKHFVLAMMDCHVKGIASECKYLDLPQNGDQAVVDGKPLPQWRGFDNRFSTGMDWQQAKPHTK